MSSYLISYNGGYIFTSPVKVRCFLDLKPPYDVCQICKRRRDERHLSKCKTGVPDLLNLLFDSEVPSPEGADLLRRLSKLVVCKWDNCQKEGAHDRLYETWCDKLWRHYVRAHKLNPEDVESRPTEFTKEEWESAFGQDDSSSYSEPGSEDDSAYWSSKEDSCPNPNYDPDDGPDADSDDDNSTGGHDVDSTEQDDVSIKPLFSEFLEHLSNNKHRNKLLDLMMQNISSNKNCCPGYIYGFRRPDCRGFIKIGYIKDEPRHKDKQQETTVKKSPGKSTTERTVKTRMDEWRKSCRHDIIKVFEFRIECNAIQRIESLIHTTLRAYRRKQDPPCEPCRQRSNDGQGGKHDEWFEVDEDKAREVVNFWTRFAQLQPYDLGQLTDFWQKEIKNQRNAKNFFPEDYPVESWMKAMTPAIEMLVGWESPGRWNV